MSPYEVYLAKLSEYLGKSPSNPAIPSGGVQFTGVPDQPSAGSQFLNTALKVAEKKLLKDALAGSAGASSPLAATEAANAAYGGNALIGSGVAESAAANAGYGGNALLGSAAIDAPVQSLAPVAPSFGGMFAGQGLAGMNAAGMAGTAALIASPLIVGPLIKKYLMKGKPTRNFKLEEVLQKNSFNRQLPGYDKLTAPQQSEFIGGLHDQGFNFRLPGYADKEGNTVKNAGAFLGDVVDAARQVNKARYGTGANYTGPKFVMPQNTTLTDALAGIKQSPVLNRGFIPKLEKLQTAINTGLEKYAEKK